MGRNRERHVDFGQMTYVLPADRNPSIQECGEFHKEFICKRNNNKMEIEQ